MGCDTSSWPPNGGFACWSARTGPVHPRYRPHRYRIAPTGSINLESCRKARMENYYQQPPQPQPISVAWKATGRQPISGDGAPDQPAHRSAAIVRSALPNSMRSDDQRCGFRETNRRAAVLVVQGTPGQLRWRLRCWIPPIAKPPIEADQPPQNEGTSVASGRWAPGIALI